MKLVYLSILLFNVVIRGEKDTKKTNTRDVDEAVSAAADYTLTKIPVYLLPNTPASAYSDGKVPVAVIPGAYPPATYIHSGVKDVKNQKYGFYAPYKTPEVTPIHEPSSEPYAVSSKVPQPYVIEDYSEKPDYSESPAYKVSVIGKDYQTSTSFVKYESTPRPILEKHHTLPHGNIYTSLTPTASHLNADHTTLGYPATPKKLSYDYSHGPQTQYYIKYVPVPYAVPSHQYASPSQYAAPSHQYAAASHQYAPASHQYAPASHQYASASETYITPKPLVHQAYKKPVYTYDVESSAAHAYASPTADDQPYKFVQPSPAYKYYDKNVYAKKYVPTSYLAATFGKGSHTHYAASIQHDSSLHVPSEHTYASAGHSGTTKLAPVPLPVDKYVVPSEDASDDTKYESEYAYAYPSTNAKYNYKTVLAVPQYYDYGSPHYSSSYHKKDTESVSATKSYPSSTPKQ